MSTMASILYAIVLAGSISHSLCGFEKNVTNKVMIIYKY